MTSTVAFEKVDCWLVLVEFDGCSRVEILVLDLQKLELHRRAGTKLFDHVVYHHFGNRPLPADRLPLDRESFALGGPPSPAYM